MGIIEWASLLRQLTAQVIETSEGLFRDRQKVALVQAWAPPKCNGVETAQCFLTLIDFVTWHGCGFVAIIRW